MNIADYSKQGGIRYDTMTEINVNTTGIQKQDRTETLDEINELLQKHALQHPG